MGRFYSVTTGFVTATGSQAYDWLDIEAGSSNGFILHQLVISQSSDYGDAQAEGLEVTIKRAISGYTNASSGSAATVKNYLSSGDAANSLAVSTRSNTTAATGTLDTIYEEAWNIQAPFVFYPTPELRPQFEPGEGLIVSLSAPADDLTTGVSATCIIEEL